MALQIQQQRLDIAAAVVVTSTIVIGHRAVVSKKNLDSYQETGIADRKTRGALQDSLVISAAKWLRSIVNLTRKVRAQAAA